MSSNQSKGKGFKLMKSSTGLVRLKKQFSADQAGYFPGQLAFSAVGKAAYRYLEDGDEGGVVVPLTVPAELPKIRVGKRPLRTIMTLLLTPRSWIDDLEKVISPADAKRTQDSIISWIDSARASFKGVLGLQTGDTTTLAKAADAAYQIVGGDAFADLGDVLTAIASRYDEGESFHDPAVLTVRLARNVASAATASLLPASTKEATANSDTFADLFGGIVEDEADAAKATSTDERLTVAIGGVALSITRNRDLKAGALSRYEFEVESEPKERGSGVLESSKYRPDELEIGEHTLTVVAGKTGTGKTALVDSLPGASKILFYETHSQADCQDIKNRTVVTAWDMVELISAVAKSQSEVVVIDSIRRLAFSGRGPMASGGFSMDVLFDLITLRAVASFLGKRLVVTLNPVDELMSEPEELAFVLRIASSVPVIHVARRSGEVSATYYDRGVLRAATPLQWRPGQALIDLPFLSESDDVASADVDVAAEDTPETTVDGSEQLRTRQPTTGVVGVTFKLPTVSQGAQSVPQPTTESLGEDYVSS